MRLLNRWLLFILSVASFACRQGPEPQHVNPRLALASVHRFGVQFSGEYRLSDMAPYELMVIDPDQAAMHAADSIAQRGGIAIAYMNIGEAETYRWFYPKIRRNWILAPNPNWPDHLYIDVNNPGWHALLLETVLPAIFSKGFQGVFLDMADVSSPALYPDLQPGIAAIIRKIREAYPEKVIIMNNGTFLAGTVNDLIDGIVVESVFATYDFANKAYGPVKKEDTETRCRELQQLVKAFGIKIFTIDYAMPGDTAATFAAARLSREQGFVPFVSTIELNSLPKPLN